MNNPGINFPLISILIPCYNEELFLENCLNSVLKNDYPKDKMEIFIIDGLSSDNTVNIAKDIISKNQESKIEILSNAKKIFPCAVNIGINNSKGEYVFILGSHAVYNKDYFSLCVETSLKYNADNTGGILLTEGLNKTIIGNSINDVLSCSFGVGNSAFRTGSDKIIETDTVFGGCYKKNIFEKIGLFNENLISTSDMDFNVRLKKNEGKIILNPAIKATYFTRNNFKKFTKNNFRNGYWAIYPLRFVDYLPVSIRHLIPLFFVSGIIGGVIFSFFSKFILMLFLAIIGLYLLAASYFSLPFLKKNFLNIFIMPFLFFVIHASYGIGSLGALVKVLFFKSVTIFKQ